MAPYDDRVVVLGIDPGLACTGFGVVRVEGQRVSALAHGDIPTRPRADPAERLHRIYARIAEVLALYVPDSAAVESLFVGLDPRAILAVGQARGVALAACGAAGIASAEYAPAQIKRAVCGSGRAPKEQMVRMISVILRLEGRPPSEHAADALAVALCHAWSVSTPALRAAR
jgi:crossover junction endodeoxyribonuclease RuvC